MCSVNTNKHKKTKQKQKQKQTTHTQNKKKTYKTNNHTNQHNQKPPTTQPHVGAREFCRVSHRVRANSTPQAQKNPHRNSGFRSEGRRRHLANCEAFKARSEQREPPAKSTKESTRVAALEEELEQFRQAAKKSE